MVILVLTSNNGCWRSEAPRFVMCTRPLCVLSLSLGQLSTLPIALLALPCPALPWQTAARAVCTSRETHLPPVVTTATTAAAAIPQIVLRV